MSRPHRNGKKILTAFIDAETHKELKVQLAKEGGTIQDFINASVIFYLESLKKENKSI